MQLRIHVWDGKSYEVTDPEMMSVTKTLVFIALPPVVEGVPQGGSVYCDPVQITGIGPLNGPKAATRRKRRKS